ncbi:MAG TPA: hydroxymethylglutaryl-CoA reductase, degradative [Thermoplasmata archaeon]|nr:hydroxymethylglutaryl-CoA reductase, degradative [Thermoplasmata archaeon]
MNTTQDWKRRQGELRMGKSSDIGGFYKLTPQERARLVKEFAGLTDEEAGLMGRSAALPLDVANRMIENVVGTFELPLGIATNFQIDGRDILVPFALEEPSVVAAASNLAKITRSKGGFTTSATDPVMIGQVQLVNVSDPFGARLTIMQHKDEIVKLCNEKDPMLVKFGGGVKDITVRVLDTPQGPMVITHLLVDTRDAMGANAVNTMAEAVAPFLERITGGKVYLRIISNLATYRLARAKAVFSKEELGGPEVVDGMISAWAFAYADPYRCATHNKGIMNGVSAVVIATGNDFRAIEAGAHSYAAFLGAHHHDSWGGITYKPLTRYEKNADGDLVGTIELPVAVGLVGGATKVHPLAKVNVKILGIKTAQDLGRILAAVGLAQNAAAMRALATEGIQRGHMTLHARTIAMGIGATPEEADEVVRRLVAEKAVRMDRAQEVLAEMRSKK